VQGKYERYHFCGIWSGQDVYLYEYELHVVGQIWWPPFLTVFF
jgi:hypothetical protein